MMDAQAFHATVRKWEEVAYHVKAISALQGRIAEMQRGEIRHYREAPDGCLNVDDTPRMVEVAEASVRLHRQILAALHGVHRSKSTS